MGDRAQQGRRTSTRVGSKKAAIRTKEDFEAKLKLGLELFPDRKAVPSLPRFSKYHQKFEQAYLKTACRASTIGRYGMDSRLCQ